MTVDAAARQWYAPDGDVIRFSLSGDQPVALPLQFGLPRLSWPCGLTFDAKRRRLLLSSFGGEGFLYAYDAEAESWSVVTSMKGVDSRGLAWSQDDDCLYAFSEDRGDTQKYSIVKLSADGAIEAKVEIGEGLPNLGHHPRIQLIPVDGRLVLLAPGEPDDDGHGSPATHSYVIDPKTGVITYTAKLTPQKRLLAGQTN